MTTTFSTPEQLAKQFEGKTIHKIREFGDRATLCGLDPESDGMFSSKDWNLVTCDKCLAKRGKS